MGQIKVNKICKFAKVFNKLAQDILTSIEEYDNPEVKSFDELQLGDSEDHESDFFDMISGKDDKDKLSKQREVLMERLRDARGKYDPAELSDDELEFISDDDTKDDTDELNNLLGDAVIEDEDFEIEASNKILMKKLAFNYDDPEQRKAFAMMRAFVAVDDFVEACKAAKTTGNYMKEKGYNICFKATEGLDYSSQACERINLRWPTAMESIRNIFGIEMETMTLKEIYSKLKAGSKKLKKTKAKE